MAVLAVVLATFAPARAVTVDLNLLYVHGVKNCTDSRQNAQGSLDDLADAVDAELADLIASYEAANPGVTIAAHSARANLYTATPSGIHPSDSPDPINMDDWEVGDPGCSTTRQGDPCTTAYEWRYRLMREINRLYPAPARNVILIAHSAGGRASMEVAANVGPSGAVGSFDWGVQSRIAGVVTLHGMINEIGSSKYNVVGPTSFETGCKSGDFIMGFGDSCAQGNGWCEYAGRVDGFPAADWVAQNRRALMLTAWGSCSPSGWGGRSDGSLPYDAQGSTWAVGLDMTPAPDETWRAAHGQLYGPFCHSAITNDGDSQHAAARSAATQRILEWLFEAAPRVAATGSGSTSSSIGFNQFSQTFTMGATCPAGNVDDTVTSGTKGAGVDVVGVCKHPGFFDGDDHAIAMSEFSVTNGATCNGTFRWQQAHDSDNNHAASFWWKTRSVYADGPDLVDHLVAQSLALCGNGALDRGETCDDGNTAAGDCCSPTCELVPAGSACASDGNACTNDVCDGAGTCGVNLPAGTACASDGNPCTNDVCDGSGACGVNTAASCDDGVFCNGADTCGGGSCSIHAGNPCAGGGVCADQCNESAETCMVATGTACTSDGNVCTNDVCDGAGTCAHVANSAPCNDGLFCNGADTCAAGSCSVHQGDPCTGRGECDNACNEAGDTCARPAGAACTSDGNICTTDACNGAGACGHTSNTVACNDGVFCNGFDTCSGGTCSVHTGDPCAGRGECDNTCNEGPRTCARPAGTPCASDGNVCTTDACNGTGACGHPHNTAPCNDGVFCNGADTCAGGSCSTHAGNPCAGGPECNDTCNESADDCATATGTSCADDGNPCTDDVCSDGGCTHVANTAPCDDGNSCTLEDRCSAGQCGGAPVTCGTCESCRPDQGCVAGPRNDCKGAPPEMSRLRIRNDVVDGRDAVSWQWRKGEAVDLSEVGVPETSDGYTLCVFDESQAPARVVFHASAPAGGLCRGKPCWTRGRSGARYKDSDLTPEGLKQLRASVGAAGKTKADLKGSGLLLSGRPGGLPALPLPTPLRVQLQAQNAACWEATFASPRANGDGAFDARSE